MLFNCFSMMKPRHCSRGFYNQYVTKGTAKNFKLYFLIYPKILRVCMKKLLHNKLHSLARRWIHHVDGFTKTYETFNLAAFCCLKAFHNLAKSHSSAIRCGEATAETLTKLVQTLKRKFSAK